MKNSSRLEMVLTSYSMPHVMGYLATQAGEPPHEALSEIAFMDAAVEMGMSGVEFPTPSKFITELTDALRQRDLSIVCDLPISLDADMKLIRQCIKDSASLGAKVVRVILSTILCGDRRNLEGGWETFLARRAGQLRELLPYARAWRFACGGKSSGCDKR